MPFSTAPRRTALITGASSGIGEAFAHELARRGMNLILTARHQDELDLVADEIRSTHPVAVQVVAADLTDLASLQELLDQIASREIDLLINNAGFGTYDLFINIEPDRIQKEVALNVLAPVCLARALLPGMISRGHGGIVNLASTAAFQPIAKLGLYGATKSFLLSWSEAVWAETRGTGVRILALCPGPTETNFFKVAGEELRRQVLSLTSPEEVVHQALKALRQDRPFYIVGRKNYLLAMSTRLAPRKLVALMSRRIAGL